MKNKLAFFSTFASIFHYSIFLERQETENIQLRTSLTLFILLPVNVEKWVFGLKQNNRHLRTKSLPIVKFLEIFKQYWFTSSHNVCL